MPGTDSHLSFLGDRPHGTLGSRKEASDAELTLKEFPSEALVRPSLLLCNLQAALPAHWAHLSDCSVRGALGQASGEPQPLSFTQSLCWVCWCHGTRTCTHEGKSPERVLESGRSARARAPLPDL